MDDQKKSSFQASFMPGVFLGIALVIFSLVMYLLGVDMQSGWQYLSLIIMVIGLYWSMITNRDRNLQGNMSYGQAFGTGFWTGLIATIIGAIFTYVYVVYIDPGFADQILANAEEKMLEQNPNMSDEQLDMALSMTEKFTSPIMIALWGFVANVIFATILSLIIAIFAKRENISTAE